MKFVVDHSSHAVCCSVCCTKIKDIGKEVIEKIGGYGALEEKLGKDWYNELRRREDAARDSFLVDNKFGAAWQTCGKDRCREAEMRALAVAAGVRDMGYPTVRQGWVASYEGEVDFTDPDGNRWHAVGFLARGTPHWAEDGKIRFYRT